MGRREENKARTRQRIIDVALELFRERGFEGTRVQDIVERVGISPATFFNYFPNKLAVVEALNQGSADLYVAFLRYVVELTDIPVLVRLEQLMRTMGMYLMADPEITRLMVEKLLLQPTEQLKNAGDAHLVSQYAAALSRLFALDDRSDESSE